MMVGLRWVGGVAGTLFSLLTTIYMSVDCYFRPLPSRTILTSVRILSQPNHPYNCTYQGAQGSVGVTRMLGRLVIHAGSPTSDRLAIARSAR